MLGGSVKSGRLGAKFTGGNSAGTSGMAFVQFFVGSLFRWLWDNLMAATGFARATTKPQD